MKAIETVFDGHRFRSRLEARWAVFFNTMKIPYQYEPQGFDLGDGIRYLPDFWLPNQEFWVEIKGAIISTEDVTKVSRFASYLKSPQGIAVFGELPRVEFRPDLEQDGYYPYSFIVPNHGTVFYPLYDESGYTCASEPCAWYICPWCGKVDIAGNERGLLCACHQEIYNQIPHPEDHLRWESVIDTQRTWWVNRVNDFLGGTSDHPRLMKSYLAATQARFEHGQSGAPHEWKGGQP